MCVCVYCRIYGLIFDIIGPNGLADDLFLYLLGLLPSMEFVSLECKKKVIEIYETKLEPLGVRLRPCLKGLITSICLGQVRVKSGAMTVSC